MDAPRPTRLFAKSLRRRMSLPEVLLWKQLKGRKQDGLHFRRQHPVGPYVLDFFCDAARLCIEIDGDGHSFGDQPEKDERRDRYLADQGVTTLRLPADYVLAELDGAIRTIVHACQSSPTAKLGPGGRDSEAVAGIEARDSGVRCHAAQRLEPPQSLRASSP
jgi:very-short-patch-repair endonuclease